MNVSDQSWIGTLPQGWELTALRWVLSERKELNKLREETNILSVTNDRGVIRYADKGDIGNKASEDIERYKKVYKGDIVANSMNVIIGSVGIAPEDGVLSPVYIVMQPSPDADTRYFDYIFKTKLFQSQLRRIGYGILDHRMRIPWDNMKVQLMPKPHIHTQKKISDYLDQETEKINDLIKKQEHLLELLEEKRNAYVVHLTTRGLNKRAELVDSNVKWLGQVPANWELHRAKYLFYKSQEKPMDSDDVVTAFRDGEVVLRSLRRTEGFTFADKEIGYQHVSKGDLVIHAMDGFAGAIGVSKSDGKMSPVCSICKPIDKKRVSTEYYAQLVRVMAKSDWLTAIAKGIRERSTDFRWSDFANMEFPLPPFDEQVAIVEAIIDENNKVNTLRVKITSQIELLKERRSSLISNVVTGKVGVE